VTNDGIGPLTYTAYLGMILILITTLNAILTAFGQNAKEVGNATGVPFQFPPPGSLDLFTGTSLMFYVLAAALFLLLVFTAWRSIRGD
jgi:ABC-type branched-subunit amino acid transport system permease subunit